MLNKITDFETLRTAVIRTATKRNSLEILKDSEEILNDIRDDRYLSNLWDVYINETTYRDLAFDKTVDV